MKQSTSNTYASMTYEQMGPSAERVAISAWLIKLFLMQGWIPTYLGRVSHNI